MKNIIYLNKFFKLSKLKLSFIFLLLFISSCIGIIIPLMIKKIMDNSSNLDYLMLNGFLILSLFIFQVFLKSISTYFLEIITEKNIVRLRLIIWEKILKLPFSFFKDNNTGNLLNIIFYDLETVTSFFITVLPNILPITITLVATMIIISILDFKITLIAVTLLIISMVFIGPLSIYLQKLSTKIQNSNSDLYDMFTSSLSSISLIKSYNGYTYEKRQSKEKTESVLKNKMSLIKIQTVINPIISIIISLMVMMIAIYCIYRLNQGTLEISTILVILLYLFQLASPLAEISSIIMMYSKAKISSDSIIKLLNTTDEFQYPHTLNIEYENFKVCHLQIKNIDFNFHDKKIFENFNLNIDASQPLGIVGKIGTGKSTIFNILERFEYPDSGEILLNNKNINDFNIKKYRSMISYVSQDSYIINGTVRENIEYGHTNTIESDFIEKYDIFNFINKLPEGLDTDISNKGHRLSGGQKQLICLARAICKNSPIILLDEISSNLDSIAEKKLKKIISKLRINKILIVISHRFSTIQDFPNILYLTNNHYYVGTHEYLLNNIDEYKKMYLNQKLNNSSGSSN